MNKNLHFKIPTSPAVRTKSKKFQPKFKNLDLLDLDDTFCNAINLENLSNPEITTPENSPNLKPVLSANIDGKNDSWHTPTSTHSFQNRRKRSNESPKVSPTIKRIVLDMQGNKDDIHSFKRTTEMNRSRENAMNTLNSSFSPIISSNILKNDSPSIINSSPKTGPSTLKNLRNTNKESTTSSSNQIMNRSRDKTITNLIDDDDDLFDNSQIFLNDIKFLDKTIIKSQLINQFQQNYNITENPETCSQYIRMERSMVQINEENVNDYEEEIHILESTQYRRDFLMVFDECEKSISNLNPNISTEIVDELDGIKSLNWDDEVFDSPNRTLHKPSNKNTPPIVQPSTSIKLTKDNNTNELNNRRKKFNLAPVSTASFRDMGPFYGLPLFVKKLIKEYKGIEEMYDWQNECLNLDAIPKRENLIYALPTSGGKTLVAEIIILREIICRKRNVLFILPFVSIVQEKVAALSPFAVNLKFLVEEYAAGKGMCPPRKRRAKNSVYICTIEKSMALVDSLIENSRANEVGLVVIDELHILGEQGRGATLESLLTKIMFLNAKIQIVGMSATIGNLNELSQFLKADIYTRDFRPVELKEYIKTGDVIMEINPNGKTNEEIFIPHKTSDFGYNESMNKQDPDHIKGLVLEVIPQHSCLIFCPTKANCENVAILLANTLPRHLLLHKKSEKEELMNILTRESGGLCQTLRQTLPFGVAYHHSGLTSDERKYLEDAFRVGILNVICCTSTLAAGVNLPAKRVILRSPYVGRDFITLSRYKQMVGRAGRTGMCGEDVHGESILLCPLKDNIRVHELICSPMDEANSSLHQNEGHGLRSLILSAIDLGLANTRNKLKILISTTMLAVQAERLQVDINELTERTIKDLFKVKAITLHNSDKNVHLATDISIIIAESQVLPGDVSITEPEKIKYKLTPNAPLEISKLGKAAIKACIDLTRAKKLYSDLLKAQQNFVLIDCLHLLYIVTPYETAETISLNMNLYYSLYNNLKCEQLITAKVIGITETCAMKMMCGKTFSSDILRILKRFFVTLMLYELWNGKSVFEISNAYKVNRGLVQNLMSAAATQASSIFRFCEELEEFWAFKELLEKFSKRLSYCCTNELLPLMELPSVKIGRARQLYNAGFKTIESIASATPNELMEVIEHMHHRLAKHLISSAKNMLYEKLETLRDEVAVVLDQIKK